MSEFVILTAEQVRAHGQQIVQSFCDHPGAVSVESAVDRAILAWLCPKCDAQLPADHPVSKRCRHEDQHKTVLANERRKGGTWIADRHCMDCGKKIGEESA